MNDLALQQRLSELGIRPQGAIASYIERARIKGATATMAAAVAFVQECARLKLAIASVGEADLRVLRVKEMLKDAKIIYQTDAEERQANYLNARADRFDAELRMMEAQEKLNRYKAERGRATTYAEIEEPKPSEEDARTEADAIIKEFINKRGGMEKMTPEDFAAIREFTEKLERMFAS